MKAPSSASTSTAAGTPRVTLPRVGAVLLAATAFLAAAGPAAVRAADHNDPNAVNSIFSDVKPDAADLYDMFGWPSADKAGGEKVILALTFAAVPRAGVLDPDLLYRVRISPGRRYAPSIDSDAGPAVLLGYYQAVKDKYAALHPEEIRVVPSGAGRATVRFGNFPGGSFARTIDLNKPVTVTAPDDSAIQVFVGGRDDAFFNDLPGFFRSINYAPEFYHVPLEANMNLRETPIPVSLLELDGNTMFNFDPQHPDYGYDQSVKRDLPPGPPVWQGHRFLRDAQGNFRFAYSGRDARAGENINTVILEIPVKYLTKNPERDRVINAWGESWVMKASSKVDTIPDDRPPLPGPFWFRHPLLLPLVVILIGAALLAAGVRRWRGQRAEASGAAPDPAARRRKVWTVLTLAGGTVAVLLGLYAASVLSSIARQKPDLTLPPSALDEELRKYKLVDTDGQPFADAALNLREDNRQLGADNFWLATHFVLRLAHLGWGFGPSISALGLKSSFDHGNSPVSVYKQYEQSEILDAFQRGRKVVFQRLNMPDDSWNPKGMDIPLRRGIDIFIPNVCAVDMDTTGTWPFGRRPEDQVATRFLSLFLDMSATIGGKPCNVESLGSQALWDSAPIVPKTPPNPLKNDKPFLKEFPYLAEPWPEPGYGPVKSAAR